MANEFDDAVDAPHDSAGGAALQQSMDDDWAAFLEARQALAEVMSDDELREFGINVEELDRKP